MSIVTGIILILLALFSAFLAIKLGETIDDHYGLKQRFDSLNNLVRNALVEDVRSLKSEQNQIKQEKNGLDMEAEKIWERILRHETVCDSYHQSVNEQVKENSKAIEDLKHTIERLEEGKMNGFATAMKEMADLGDERWEAIKDYLNVEEKEVAELDEQGEPVKKIELVKNSKK